MGGEKREMKIWEIEEMLESISEMEKKDKIKKIVETAKNRDAGGLISRVYVKGEGWIDLDKI